MAEEPKDQMHANAAGKLGAEGDSEIHITRSAPSGWNTPENVRLLIEQGLPRVDGWIEAWRHTERASIDAARSSHGRMVLLAGLVSVGVIAAALIGLLVHNDPSLAERLLVPLLTFIGGLGLGARFSR